MRTPIVGLIPPHRKRRITIAPAMTPSERVVLLSQATCDVIDPVTVIVQNPTDHVVTFTILVVHRMTASVGRLPWGQIVTELRTKGGPERVLTAFLSAAQRHLLGDKPDPHE